MIPSNSIALETPTPLPVRPRPSTPGAGGRERLRLVCPVCAGPLVWGEGSAGCTLCGYALRSIAQASRNTLWRRRAMHQRRALQWRMALSPVQPADGILPSARRTAARH